MVKVLTAIFASLVIAAIVMMLVREEPATAQATEEERLSGIETRVAALETQVAVASAIPPSPTSPAAPTSQPPDTDSSGTVIGSAELLYYYSRDSAYGGSEILGEFRNGSDQLVRTPTLNFTFYDTNGQLVDTATTSPIAPVMAPGEVMPFTASIDLGLGDWASEEFTAEGGLPAEELDLVFYAQGLEIQNVNEVQASGDTIRVLGEVVNGGSSPAALVQVNALIYSADGRFSEYELTFIDVDALQPGQSAPFEIDSSVDSGSSWTYRLVVSGWPQ